MVGTSGKERIRLRNRSHPDKLGMGRIHPALQPKRQRKVRGKGWTQQRLTDPARDGPYAGLQS